ncbi:3,4-dihydroxy-2-butanone-4-phosphate synthase [archaeon]|jgi:3,4-dihydroxy 2-butanone 4-phosphate synthase/GTP cyclohydrolase II|nr:3,4-dihydroxy-2-butanone-4-phosphate synthase [archaeon]MDP6547688.1 3,4-dihydroxy-2-butanone-4-phosphate synthase [Candidatus Woesearchaeota archaeon]|tara:strand:- start:13778 stop:14440 length:663 start_codon:yes stop_codon:yes gene_type:complete
MVFSKIEDAVNDIKRGKFVIVVDDENRENEGDLVLAAAKVTAHKINYMIKHARGLVCMPIIKEKMDQLNIPLMINHNEINRCKFTMSVDCKNGTTTGISPADRAATILALIDNKSKPEDFAMPGHMFPLIYHEGGVLAREGHTEASVDLSKLAGLYPAAIICEIINDDGSMAKLPDLIEFSKNHNDMKIINIKDLVKYIKNNGYNKAEENSAEQESVVAE